MGHLEKAIKTWGHRACTWIAYMRVILGIFYGVAREISEAWTAEKIVTM